MTPPKKDALPTPSLAELEDLHAILDMFGPNGLDPEEDDVGEDVGDKDAYDDAAKHDQYNEIDDDVEEHDEIDDEEDELDDDYEDYPDDLDDDDDDFDDEEDEGYYDESDDKDDDL